MVGIPALSGAFMLVRRAAIDRTGGFDPEFFLYFEDFDWTVRLNRITVTAYVPSVQVIHHGGYAARKGWTVAEAERWLAPLLNYNPRAMDAA